MSFTDRAVGANIRLAAWGSFLGCGSWGIAAATLTAAKGPTFWTIGLPCLVLSITSGFAVASLTVLSARLRCNSPGWMMGLLLGLLPGHAILARYLLGPLASDGSVPQAQRLGDARSIALEATGGALPSLGWLDACIFGASIITSAVLLWTCRPQGADQPPHERQTSGPNALPPA